MRIFFLFVMSLAILTTQPGYSVAAKDQTPVKKENTYPFTFVFENDVIGGTDEGYTNGVVMSIAEPWRKEKDKQWQGFLFDLGDKLTTIPTQGREKRRTFAFGQAMITPTDIEVEEYLPDDYPYAGLFFGRVVWTYQNDKEADEFGILLGIMGPSSQADAMQKWVHKGIGAEKPEGWDNQLKDEPLINISYEHKWKVYDSFLGKKHSPMDMAWDVTPYVGGMLGNIASGVYTGGIVRVGTGANRFPATIYKGGIGSLPDIGSSIKAPFVYYFFLGLEGAYTANSFITNGNTFEDTHDLDLNPFSISSYGGIGLGYKRFRLSFFSVRGSKKFEEQHSKHRYGSITLGWIF